MFQISIFLIQKLRHYLNNETFVSNSTLWPWPHHNTFIPLLSFLPSFFLSISPLPSSSNRIREFIHSTCNLLIHTNGLMFMAPRFWRVKLCVYGDLLPIFTSYTIVVSFFFWCFVFTLSHPVLNFSGLILFPFRAIEYILIRSVCG